MLPNFFLEPFQVQMKASQDCMKRRMPKIRKSETCNRILPGEREAKVQAKSGVSENDPKSAKPNI